MFHPIKKVVVGVGALAALALGGSALAGAATSSTSSSTSTTAHAASGMPARPAFKGPAHGTAAHEDAEKPVTGATAAKVQAAAVKSVGGGTPGAVTTDLTQRGYEVTVTKSDGSKVEVHLDSSLRAFHGPGGPGGPHRPGGPRGPGGPAGAPTGAMPGA